MKNKIQRLTYGIGLLLFLFPVTLFSIATVWLMIGFDINAVLFPLSMVISAVFFYLLLNSEGYKKQTFFWGVVFAVGLCAILFAISGHFFDFSFDGQWYHQDAIILLKNGWNPFYDQPILDEIASGKNANYINCYPKAPWTISACVYATTGAIEYAKFYQLVLLFASFFSIHSFHASMVLFFNFKRFHVIVCCRFFSCGGWPNAQFLCGWAVSRFYITYALFFM